MTEKAPSRLSQLTELKTLTTLLETTKRSECESVRALNALIARSCAVVLRTLYVVTDDDMRSPLYTTEGKS
jgi:hypothetical protein